MAVEPKGILNYVIPVFSETFIEMEQQRAFFPGKMGNGFKAFSNQSKRPPSMNRLGKMRISKFAMSRILDVLSEAAQMAEEPLVDMEYLFGLYPVAAMTGQLRTLTEMMESENDLSDEVKDVLIKLTGDGSQV